MACHIYEYIIHICLYICPLVDTYLHIFIYSIGIYRRDSVALRLKHFGGHMRAERQQKMQKQCIGTEPVVGLSSGCQKHFMKHLQESVCSDPF